MTESQKIDFSKLLGFQILTDEPAERVDFQDETFGGRLGAKVGAKNDVCDLPKRQTKAVDHE